MGVPLISSANGARSGVAPQRAIAGQWWIAVLGSGLLLAVLTVGSLQLGCAVACIALVTGLYARDAKVGMAAMWGLWLIGPGIRRVLGLETGYIAVDPMALAPFVATAGVIAIELARNGLPRQLRPIWIFAGAGMAVGVPVGAAHLPTAMAYNLLAYGVAFGASLLGYREASKRRSSVPGILLYGAPLVGLYGVLQHAFPPPAWDQAWLDSVVFTSIGSSDPGEFRVFSTLNSPGTLAIVLALAVVAMVATPRFTAANIVGLVCVVPALALTLGRSAWIAMLLGLIVLLIVTRCRYWARTLALVLGLVACLALAGGTAVVSGVAGRADSLGSLGSDTSAQDRLALADYLPIVVSQPLGHGLGQAGEATRLGGPQTLRAPDNGFLSLMYQCGPVGFALMAAAAAIGLAGLWRLLRRGARAAPPGIDVLIATFGVMLLGLMWAGDILYGITGIMFGYAVGWGCRMKRPEGEAT